MGGRVGAGVGCLFDLIVRRAFGRCLAIWYHHTHTHIYLRGGGCRGRRSRRRGYAGKKPVRLVIGGRAQRAGVEVDIPGVLADAAGGMQRERDGVVER